MSVVLITTPSAILLDADDPIERMLLLLGFLLMADEPDNLLFVLAGEVALQGYDTAGNLSLMRRQAVHSASKAPSARAIHRPAPLVTEGAALRADRPVMQLLLTLG
jgi:hypothetical protein